MLDKLKAWLLRGKTKPSTAKPIEPVTFSRQCNCGDPDCRLEELYPVKWHRRNLFISNRCTAVRPDTKCLGVYPHFSLYRVE